MEIVLKPLDKALCEEVILKMELGRSVAQVCKDLGVAPSTVLRKIMGAPYLLQRYQAAKEALAEIHFSRAEEIAERVIDPGDPLFKFQANASVAIGFHRWAAEKRDPAMFGTKSETTVTHRAAPTQMTVHERLKHFASLQREEINVTPTEATPDAPAEPTPEPNTEDILDALG